MAEIPGKKMEQDYILVLGTTIHFFLIPYKVSGNSLQGFKRSCAYKNKGRVKDIHVPPAKSCVGYNYCNIKFQKASK